MHCSVNHSIKDFETIPKSPGCYIFKSKPGEIIYIGKSKSLRDRVRQYFYPGKKVTKVDASYNGHFYLNDAVDKDIRLAREIYEILTITTDTETDALILECRLVKEYKPRYNAQLKKTQKYPYLRIGIQEDYPSISFVDNIITDDCKYYGGFYDSYDAKDWIESFGDIWQTPSCGKSDFSTTTRPCFNHHIGKCLAPCERKTNPMKYMKQIDELVRCLDGDFEDTFQRLHCEMATAAEAQDFERAAKLRDQIHLLQRLRKRQKSFCTQLENRQVYLYIRAHNEQRYSLFFINNGHTLNRMDFHGTSKPEKKQLEQFVMTSKEKTEYTDESKFLTDCLLDIRASKCFVPMANETETQQAVDCLFTAFSDFMFADIPCTGIKTNARAELSVAANGKLGI